MYLVMFVLVLGIILTFLNIYQLQIMREDHAHVLGATVEGSLEDKPGTGLVVWVEGKHQDTGYLQQVYVVFKQLGYTVGDRNDDWTILWSHDYPFKTLMKELAHLKKHQRVNHFPGSGFVTNKVSLATSKMNFIPRAFKLPVDKDQFLAFSENHPEIMWVQKNNNHRGIQIKKTSELDLTKDGSFIQQFVDKPFLIDGHKFDIGIYTILTSINPLRVYIIHDDALFRFCPDKYYPFDPSIRDKYVVHDDYMPLWKIPSLHDLYSEKGYNFKVTFNEYMKSKGHNNAQIWTDIVSAIQHVYQEKENNLIEASVRFPTSHHFFEMVRFDFVLDENLSVYLMEANMSPNLSSKHFPPNRRLYQHVLYTLLNLVGVSQYVSADHDEADEDMRVAATEIRVFPDACAKTECSESCTYSHCQLCRRCVSKTLEKDFKFAYLEHNRRGGARRVIPPPINATQIELWDPVTEWPGLEELSEANKLMYLWFLAKCKIDRSYCE